MRYLESTAALIKYWRKRDKRMTPETAKLHSQVKEVHRQSNGSSDARTVTMIATNNGYHLSRYRAGNIMKKLELVSCQLPKHAYKKSDTRACGHSEYIG